MLSIVTKINKWAVDGHQGELYIHKAWYSVKWYSDYNSAAKMLDRTRGKK